MCPLSESALSKNSITTICLFLFYFQNQKQLLYSTIYYEKRKKPILSLKFLCRVQLGYGVCLNVPAGLSHQSVDPSTHRQEQFAGHWVREEEEEEEGLGLRAETWLGTWIWIPANISKRFAGCTRCPLSCETMLYFYSIIYTFTNFGSFFSTLCVLCRIWKTTCARLARSPMPMLTSSDAMRGKFKYKKINTICDNLYKIIVLAALWSSPLCQTWRRLLRSWTIPSSMADASTWWRIAAADAAAVVAAAAAVVVAPVRPARAPDLAHAGGPAPAARRTRAPSRAVAPSPAPDAPSPSHRLSRVPVPAPVQSKW